MMGESVEGSGPTLDGNFGLRGGRLPRSRVHRDLFPIPLLEDLPPLLHDGRRSVRRHRVRERDRGRVNSSLAALNWMSGWKFCEDIPRGRVDASFTQGEVQARVEGLVAERREPTDLDTPEGALRQLLRGRSPYDLGDVAVNIAPFRMESVSLPSSVSGCPRLIDVLPPGPRAHLEGYQQRMLRDDVSPSDITPARPHWDIALQRNKKSYFSLVRRLFSIGLVRVVERSLEEIGLFTVWKSDKTSQRLIVDARRSNCHFKPPPGVELLSSEGFGRVEVELPSSMQIQDDLGQAWLRDLVVRFGGADVKDCFHRFFVPTWLSEYFTLPPLPAHVVGLVGARRFESQGGVYGHDELITLGWAVLPMGYTWSLYYAQEANSHRCLEASSLSTLPSGPDALISDRGAAFVIDGGRKTAENIGQGAFVYVDNLGCIVHGTETKKVEARTGNIVGEWSESFESAGLLLHKSEVSEKTECLGVQLDGSKLRSTITDKRFWRTRQAVRGVLGLRRVSGWSLEVVIGHLTFCGLSNRSTLSCFHTVYRFISSCYTTPTPLWAEVRSELVCFLGLLELLRADWWLPWSPEVHQSDSSLSGWGVKHATWPVATVAACGRISERSRFKRLGAHSAREHALSAAGLKRLDSGSWVASEAEGWEDDLKSFSVKGSFPEVPKEGLRESLWKTCVLGPWIRKEKIFLLEARSVVRSIQRVCNSVYGHDCRCLFLGDNMGVILSFARSRSSDFETLVQVRKGCAYLLARNVKGHFRWIPSELCSADLDSRETTGDSKILTHTLEPYLFQGLEGTSTSAPWDHRLRVIGTHGTEEKEDDRIDERGEEELSAATSRASGEGGAVEKEELGGGHVSDHEGEVGEVWSADLGQRARGPRSVPSRNRERARRRCREKFGIDGQQHVREVGREKKREVAQQRRAARKEKEEIVRHGDGGCRSTRWEPPREQSDQSAWGRPLQELHREVQGLLCREKLDTFTAHDVDTSMVKYFNIMFLIGKQPTFGEYTLAAWMHTDPNYSRLGSQKLPRAWRAVRGWKKLSPHRTRRPQSMPIWAAMAWRMVVHHERQMGVFLLTCLSSYCRPGELMSLRRCDLIPPVKGTTKAWSLLLFPEEELRESKTGQFNDSISLDSVSLSFLTKDYIKMHQPQSVCCAWSFTYPEFLQEWKRCTEELGLQRLDLVPYQLRHSGPSIDLARGTRSLGEAQKRGRWAGVKSMNRYERRGRLGQDYQTLTESQKSTFEIAEKSLEAIFSGHRHEARLPAVGWLAKGSSSQISSAAAEQSQPRAIVWDWQRDNGK